MRGSRHTGCLAGFVQIMPTLLSACKVRTTWYSSPNNQLDMLENQVSCLFMPLNYQGMHFNDSTRRPLAHRIGKLTSVTPLPHGFHSPVHATSGVNNWRLLHDKTILLQTGNIAAGVGQRNFIDLIGVKPDFTLPAFENWCGEALLKFEGHYEETKKSRRVRILLSAYQKYI